MALVQLASSTVSAIAPATAVALNPLNSDARIALIGKLLENAKPDLGLINTLIDEGLQFSRGDGRLYSLKGLAAAQQGDEPAARVAFAKASAIAPLEFQALRANLRIAIKDNNMALAARNIDLLYRRWPAQASSYASLVLPVISNPDGFLQVAERFSENTASRLTLVQSLQSNPLLLAQLSPLVEKWAKANVADQSYLVANMTTALIERRSVDEAYAFYKMARSTPLELASFFNNSQFANTPDGTVFDWSGLQLRGASINLSAENGAVVRFLNSPSAVNTMIQIVQIPAGRYSLKIEYAAQQLKAPAELQFRLQCLGSGQMLANFPLETGTYALKTAAVDFAVPTECRFQRTTLVSAYAVESWSNRLSGTLQLRTIAAEAAQQ